VLRKLLVLSIIILAQRARADTAADYFHRGAQAYVFGQNEKAITEVETGLATFPTDAALNELALLLKQQQEEQKQQQQQQQQEQQQQQDQQKSEQQQQDSQSDSQDQSNSDPQKSESQEKSDSKQEETSKPESSPDKKDEANQRPDPKDSHANGPDPGQADPKDAAENATPVAAGQMSPQKAIQLLEAQKEDERMLPVPPNQQPQRGDRPIKDW
jgi:hypothetical protein